MSELNLLTKRKSHDCMEIVFYYVDLNKTDFVAVIITHSKYDATGPDTRGRLPSPDT